MDTGPQKTGVGVQVKTKVSTRTKVIVGAAVAGVALAAGLSLPFLRKPTINKCPPEAWRCSEWIACTAGGVQTRTCRPKTLSCAGINSPATQQVCQLPAAKAAPTISMTSLPSSTLMNGTNALARFSAIAANSGDAALKELRFSIDKSPELTLASSGDSSIRRVGDATNIPGATTLVTCGVSSLQCAVSVAFTDEQVIAAGTAATFELRLNVTGGITDSFLKTKMDQPAVTDFWTLIR